jgi:hypothetical protein
MLLKCRRRNMARGAGTPERYLMIRQLCFLAGALAIDLR